MSSSIKNWLKPLLIVFILLNTIYVSNAQTADSIFVVCSKKQLVQGDTLNFEVNLKNYKAVAKLATIQLWVEDIATGKKWTFRYPLINGYVNAAIKIDATISNGNYAFNFLLQKKFFSCTGIVNNVKKKDKLLTYVLFSKSKQPVIDVVSLDDNKAFTVGNLLFQDSAYIIFSKPKQKNNNLLIDVKTMLDSSFIPSATVTQFIAIGNQTKQQQANTSMYHFLSDDVKYKSILPEVIIKSTAHKKVEDFNTENTTGMFTGNDAIVLDGLSTDEIANTPDIYTYLTLKVAGLKLETDNLNGSRYFTWRGQTTDVYINEFKLEQDIPITIDASDIAMIKIFRPGTSVNMQSGNGGAIAIYTKKGLYQNSNDRRYSFYILGYSPLLSIWQ